MTNEEKIVSPELLDASEALGKIILKKDKHLSNSDTIIDWMQKRGWTLNSEMDGDEYVVTLWMEFRVGEIYPEISGKGVDIKFKHAVVLAAHRALTASQDMRDAMTKFCS